MCEQILLLFTEAFSLQAFLRDRRSCNSPNCRLLLLELRLYYKNSKKGSEIKRGTLYISLILLYHTRIRLFSTRQITETGYFYVFNLCFHYRHIQSSNADGEAACHFHPTNRTRLRQHCLFHLVHSMPPDRNNVLQQFFRI